MGMGVRPPAAAVVREAEGGWPSVLVLGAWPLAHTTTTRILVVATSAHGHTTPTLLTLSISSSAADARHRTAATSGARYRSVSNSTRRARNSSKSRRGTFNSSSTRSDNIMDQQQQFQKQHHHGPTSAVPETLPPWTNFSSTKSYTTMDHE